MIIISTRVFDLKFCILSVYLFICIIEDWLINNHFYHTYISSKIYSQPLLLLFSLNLLYLLATHLTNFSTIVHFCPRICTKLNLDLALV